MKRKLLPPPEIGVHAWLFGRAVYLRREGFDQAGALDALRAHVGASEFRPGRSVIDREIVATVASAFRSTAAATPPRPGSSTTTAASPQLTDYDEATGWPAEMAVPRTIIDRELLERVFHAAGGFELPDLWESSPVRPPDHPAPRWALTQLFDESALLCIGKSNADFTARPLRDWNDGELFNYQFIVPNPNRKIIGKTKAGGDSAHCRDATGPRRFIIFESDADLALDQQAIVIEHLRVASKAPLAAVVLSGNKSLHGWFRVRDGVPSAQLHRWFEYAISVGGDPRLWLPEQFVRLPDGRRDNGARQGVIFLTPTP